MNKQKRQLTRVVLQIIGKLLKAEMPRYWIGDTIEYKWQHNETQEWITEQATIKGVLLNSPYWHNYKGWSYMDENGEEIQENTEFITILKVIN